MFAEHKYGFGHGLFLVSRFYGSYPVSLIKAAGGSIHHITQIGQGRYRETVAGRSPHVQLTAVSNTTGGNQPVYRLAAPVGYHRGGYEPVLRQIDCNGGSRFLEPIYNELRELVKDTSGALSRTSKGVFPNLPS